MKPRYYFEHVWKKFHLLVKMSHICSKPQISVWISRPGLTGEPVFPGIPYPSIPSGSCRHGVGSLCLNRALRSCSADPLPPGSATLTFLLPSVLCCPQTPTAPARIDHQKQRMASTCTVRDIGPCSKHVFLFCCSDIWGLTHPGETTPPRPSWFLEMVNLPSSALFLWKNNQSRAHLKTPSKNWSGWNCHIKNI